MSEVQLPEDWVWVTIPKIIGRKGVFCDGDWVESKDQDENGEVRLIQLADIGDGYFRNKSNRFLTHQKAIKLGCSFIKKGDILVARMPDPLGRACIFPLAEENSYVTVVDVCIIRPALELVDVKLLTYWINSPQIRSKINSLQSGSTRKRISRKNLAQIQLPLPLLPVQHQIVARIEELFSELDAGVNELKTALSRLKTYRQAMIDQALDPTDKDWKVSRLGKLADIRGGVTKGRNLEGKNTVSTPYLRVANVQDGYLDLKVIKTIDVLPSDVLKYKLQDQDILFTEGGDKDKLGRGTVWKNQIPDCIHQNHIFRARVNHNLLAPIFLTYTAKTTKSRRYFYQVAKQTTNLASINLGQLSSLEIPLPDRV